MSLRPWWIACAVLASTGVGWGRTPLPPFDFGGHWTGLVLADLNAFDVEADLANDGTKKFTGPATVDGVPCTLRGKRKRPPLVKVRMKCADGTKLKAKGVLDIDTELIAASGRVKKRGGKAAADLLLQKEMVTAAVCGNAVLEPGEECDDGNVADGDGCDAGCLVDVAAEVDEVEPNGVAEQATPIDALPGLAHGALSSFVDEDFYRIDFAGGDLVLETFDGVGIGSCGGFSDTVIELRGPDGTSVIGIDDDDGIGLCARLELHDLPAGVYYPCVRSGSGLSVAAYQLLVNAP